MREEEGFILVEEEAREEGKGVLGRRWEGESRWEAEEASRIADSVCPFCIGVNAKKAR